MQSELQAHLLSTDDLHVLSLQTAVSCGTLANPGNGSVSYSGGTTYGHRATYSCNTGYNLVGGSTRRCQARTTTGFWSGSASTCRRMLLLTVPSKMYAHDVFLSCFDSCELWQSD